MPLRAAIDQIASGRRATFRPGGVAVAAIALCAASPAAAQHGVLWSDGHGQTIALKFGGIAQPLLQFLDRPTAEMASLFKRLCVDTNGMPEAIGAAASEQGFEWQPVDLPASKKEHAVRLSIWRGRGLAVAQTYGFSQVPLLQCNITFQVASPPERAAVADAISAQLGAPPFNAATAFKKNGKPNKSYCPEWNITGPDGTAWIAAAIVSKAGRFTLGNQVQISLRAQKATET